MPIIISYRKYMPKVNVLTIVRMLEQIGMENGGTENIKKLIVIRVFFYSN